MYAYSAFPLKPKNRSDTWFWGIYYVNECEAGYWTQCMNGFTTAKIHSVS